MSHLHLGHVCGRGRHKAGEVDLALVLHPDFWGYGRPIFDEIVRGAFSDMGFDAVVTSFPPSRARVRGIFRLGFVKNGEAVIAGERFLRYRLYKAA